MKINKLKLLRNFILITLFVGLVGTFFANRFIKTKRFDNLGDFITNYWNNYNLKGLADVKVVEILMSDKDYSFLKDKRDEGMARGIQKNDGDNYIDCKVVLNQDTTKGEFRLKGHMTDHLEGEKWSFRVKTKEDVMGMYRFSLQHPGTRNYVYEWVYHELLKEENIIALKYDFIRLKLNEKDLGIYAIEEHFGQHIPKANNRPKGAILRWDPELYWEGRINELEKNSFNETYSDFESSFVDAYDNGVVKKDDEIIDTYLRGAKMLEDFRRGDIAVSEVFDIELLAKFHAIIDLVGGQHSLDWSDVKFFYNSETKKIEPVGYESFSIRETFQVAGQRIPDNYSDLGNDYHNLLFADPIFYEAYIRHLTRICSDEYVGNFQKKIQGELDKKLGILAHEFAYIKFSWKPYFRNVELIKKNIELPKPFHAFLEAKSDSNLMISITPVSDYPIEILSLSINDKADIKLKNKFVLPAKARKTYANYYNITFNHDNKKLKNLVLKAKIPGGSTIFNVEVSDLPSYKKVEENEKKQVSIKDSALVWSKDSTARFSDKITTIKTPIFIPSGATLVLMPGQTVHIEENGQLIIEGSLKCLGQEENMVFITSNSSAAYPILIADGRARFSHVNFNQTSSDLIKIQNAKVAFSQCTFVETKGDLIAALHSDVYFINCASGGMNSLGVFDRSAVHIENFTANYGQNFINGSGSIVRILASSIKGYEKAAILDETTSLYCWGTTFVQNDLIASLNHSSYFISYSAKIKSGKTGFSVNDDARSIAPSTFDLYKTNTDKLERVQRN